MSKDADSDRTAQDGATLPRLRALIAAEQGPLAAALVDAGPRAGEVFGPLAAAGPRAAAAPGEYSLLVESIFEGYLMHYARGRVLGPDDDDLRLLGGDYLYAVGLERLARLGDIDAVAELADLISLCAQAHTDADAAAHPPWRLCAALWSGATIAVGWGGSPGHTRGKNLARSCVPGAADELLAEALQRAAEVDVEGRLRQAVIAFDSSVENPVSTT